jgi:CRISPR-associated protein Csm4
LKFYEITIRPLSAFGTSLKGDTLFGHFCWQAAYDPSLLEGGLEKALAQYPEKPFAVFGTACPKFKGKSSRYVFKRPDVPLSWLFPAKNKENCEQRYKDMKENKKRKWMLLGEDLQIDLVNSHLITNEDLAGEALGLVAPETRKLMEDAGDRSLFRSFLQPHNTINRLSGTTGTGAFAPYSTVNDYYCPETELAIFVWVDETLTRIESIRKGLEAIGRFGFGRDASTGLGRFEIVDAKEFEWPRVTHANAAYTLAPCVPETYNQAYFTPFIRYGKHGDRLATSQNPFKNPVIMADEGAVFVPVDAEFFDKPYMGRAVTGVSKAQTNAVTQGYAPYLPLRLEY